MRLMNIASGSSGNSTVVKGENGNILIDAGLSGKKIREGVEAAGLTMDDIDAIFITHEHVDHMKGLGVILKKNPIPVYSTEGTIDAMMEKGSLEGVDEELFNGVAYCEEVEVGDLTVKAYSISHDAADPVCYEITDDHSRAVVVTDLGEYNDRLLKHLEGADYYLVESNHDVSMLESNRRYSYALKRRILGPLGHLSNEASAKFVASLIRKSLPKAIVLGHLSRDNNIPECARMNMENYLKGQGYDLSKIDLFVASRSGPTKEVSI